MLMMNARVYNPEIKERRLAHTEGKHKRCLPWDGRIDPSFRPSEKWGDWLQRTQGSLQFYLSRKHKSILFLSTSEICPHPSFPSHLLTTESLALLPITLSPFHTQLKSLYQNKFHGLDCRKSCFYHPEGSTLMEKIKYFSIRVGCFFDRQLWCMFPIETMHYCYINIIL